MNNWDRIVSGHGGQLERNRKRIYATQTICGICGRPVNFDLKYPHPLSPTIDHIIPVSKGGHPSDIDNLQLAHRCCNRAKSDKLVERRTESREATLSPRVLPQTFDWFSKPLKAVGRVEQK
jgi:5-methylcytosine-specific restriction endonuclease McrA